MPKTVAVLNKLGAVEFLKHNKVGDNTFPNLIPLLLGKHATELPEICWPSTKMTFDNCPFIWHRFRQAGFLTAYGEDYVDISMFNYIKRGFAGDPTDYYLRTFLYEAEAYAKSKQSKSGLLCMNENYTFKILLDYVEDLTALSEIKLFGIFWENTISHDKFNYPTLMDDDYTALFKKMYYSGDLNKSIILLISDHGRRYGKFRETRQGFLEDRLPFVIALMPPSFRNNFSEAYKNLKHNIHRLTTPFDVHATLSDLVNVKTIENDKIIARTNESYWNERSISLFLPIPENRTCKSAAIDAHWCVDYSNTQIDFNSYLAREALEHAVSHLNSLFEAYPHCAKLTLDKVLDVTRLLSDTINEKIRKSIELTVTFRTSPGGGEFEATLGKQGGNSKSWILLGSASRLNAYGNQSHCVEDNSAAKLYCYCI